MLILILIDFQYSQNAVFSFEKGSNCLNHSYSDSLHPVKKCTPTPPTPPPPVKFLIPPPLGGREFTQPVTAIWKSLITVLNFPLEPESNSFQEPFFNKDDENETEQERSSSRVSQTVKE